MCVQGFVCWPEECPRLIGRLPDGPASAIAVDGQLAYLGSGATVQVLDVTDPASPQRVGRVEVATDIRRVVAEDGLVYVAASYQGLTIIDATDPSAPAVASRLMDPDGRYEFDSHRDVVALGRTAFVAAGYDGLKIFDVADPQHPVETAAIEVPGFSGNVAVTANHAFVGASYDLVVVDVSDPGTGSVVATIPSGFASDIVAAESMVYMVGDDGMRIVDVSDPAAPTVIGVIGWSSYIDSVFDLDLRGDLAFVSDSRHGVRVVDVSEPTAPHEVALIVEASDPRGVAALVEQILVAEGTTGLRTFDVSAPASPVETGVLEVPGRVRDVAVDGARGVAMEWNRLRILDTTDPTDPVETGAYDPATAMVFTCVDLLGDFAYVCDERNDRVVIVDLSNPGASAQVAEIGAGGVNDLVVVSPYVYIAADDLLIVDISDPAEPSLVGISERSGGHRGSIAVELPYVYMTRWALESPPGLNIIDVSDPSQPQTVGSAFQESEVCCGRIAVSDSWAYVVYNPTDSDGILNVVDARDPSDPVVVVDSLSTYYVQDVQASGSSVVIGRSDYPGGALLELNVTNPADPIVVGRRDPPGKPRAIHLEGDRWYVAEYEAGIEVFELCNTGLQDAAWLEIAAHGSGKSGSDWRTDAVVRNLGDTDADLELTLYADGIQRQLTNTVAGRAQAVFEDVVGMMGFEGKGALEVRSNQPVSVLGRIYTETDDGTLGQFLQGVATRDGLADGEAAWLHGLRQIGQTWRSNISVTNSGHRIATVRIILYGTDGVELAGFELEPIEPGEVVQEIAPLANRAGRPGIGWAMAKVEVVSGFGVLASASVVDSRTNDPTTIPMVRKGDRR